MAVNCCIIDCNSVISEDNIGLPFPKKTTLEYKKWFSACKASQANIRRLKNPKICRLHFSHIAIVDGKLLPNVIPSQRLGAAKVNVHNHEMASINQLVAEWLTLTREKMPQLIVDSNRLKAKAREVANILKMQNFDIEFEWIRSFENYLNENGFPHWEDDSENLNKNSNANVPEKSVAKEFDVDLTEDEESTVALDPEQTIQTYRQALEKVKLLEDYVKKTKNNNAIELVAHLQEILINTLD